MEPIATATFGRHRLPVVPQRHARLRRKLSGEDLQAAMGGDYSHHSYRILSVLIPELPEKIPEHEWDGFASEDDWKHWKDTGEDLRPEERADDEDDLSPTTSEMIDAFELAFKVSGGAKLGKLLSVLMDARKLANQETSASPSPTPDSPPSAGVSGEST